MEKYLILKDPNRGKFFTDRWEKYWCSDIEDAKLYSPNENMDEIMDEIHRNSDYPLENVDFVEVVTVYKK